MKKRTRTPAPSPLTAPPVRQRVRAKPASTLRMRRGVGWDARAPAYRIVGCNLAEANRLHKPDALAVGAESPAHDYRVMFEHQQPALGLGPAVQRTPALERHQRLQVVAHDPRQRQVRRG